MQSRGIDYIEAFFAEDGDLAARLENYEFREAQSAMAGSIFETFAAGGFTCCEAGTGIGKTISYLLPAILWSVESDERVIVSTHTINLQEQIVHQDLPLLKSVLPVSFRHALVKGRRNYLCLRRWTEYASQPSLSFVPGEESILKEMFAWVEGTITGDLSHRSPLHPRRDGELWRKICCDSHFCTETECPDQGRCFLRKARRKALSSHIVVVNHSLLIADRMSDGGVLGDYGCLIVDESQNLPKVARESLKIDTSRSKLSGRVRLVGKWVARGGSGKGSPGMLPEASGKEIRRLCRRLERTIGAFFMHPVFRTSRDDEGKGRFPEKSRYRQDDAMLIDLRKSGADLLEELSRLQFIIEDALEGMDAEESQDGRIEVIGHLEMLRECKRELELLLNASDDENVYWIEKRNGEEGGGSSLNAVPVDVASRMREILFSNLRVGVFTSATLRIMDSFQYFLQSIGLDQMLDQFRDSSVLSSPFHYQEQAMIMVPSFLPSPRDGRYRDALVQLIGKTVLSLRRGTLVLFTSVELLEFCYNRLREALEGEGILCLGQGIDGTRDQITHIFKKERNSVLFGTDSFWEGVDIPGEALEVLIFTRLPFSVPSDPISLAIEESIRDRGGNPFIDHFLPNAVMKFRQGFGRLIRNSQDRGVALIMDNRILNQQYGIAFVDSLPIMPEKIDSEEDWIKRLTGWWS